MNAAIQSLFLIAVPPPAIGEVLHMTDALPRTDSGEANNNPPERTREHDMVDHLAKIRLCCFYVGKLARFRKIDVQDDIVFRRDRCRERSSCLRSLRRVGIVRVHRQGVNPLSLMVILSCYKTMTVHFECLQILDLPDAIVAADKHLEHGVAELSVCGEEMAGK